MQKLTAVSLFSGAGGMDVGFENSGYDILFANDIDPVACDTYDLNHGTQIRRGSLAEYEHCLTRYEGVDVVFGGPPCQGFSVAGKMDPYDRRSQLVWSFMNSIELIRPVSFVLENVKALAVNKRWMEVRNGLISRAESLDYVTALFVLNASDFGVPQARERMFLIGINRHKVSLASEELTKFLADGMKTYHRSPQTISELVRGLGRAGSPGNGRVCTAKIIFAKNPVLRKSPYAGMLFNGSGRPNNSSGVARTLSASMGGNRTLIIDEGEIFDGLTNYVEEYHQYLLDGNSPRIGSAPKRLRRITVDEASAIQTFPDDYKLVGKQSAMYRQIGNAVPCDVSQAVAGSVAHIINGNV